MSILYRGSHFYIVLLVLVYLYYSTSIKDFIILFGFVLHKEFLRAQGCCFYVFYDRLIGIRDSVLRGVAVVLASLVLFGNRDSVFRGVAVVVVSVASTICLLLSFLFSYLTDCFFIQMQQYITNENIVRK